MGHTQLGPGGMGGHRGSWDLEMGDGVDSHSVLRAWRVDLEGQMKIIQLCKEVGVILAVVLGQSQS